jgi:uncharacterized protein
MRRREPEVRASRIGKGLFARRRYGSGEEIVKITGRRVKADDVWDRGGKFADNCFRSGPETFLDPEDGLGRYLNHSCAPNAAVVKRNHQLFLVAAKPIRPNDEIVIDYSTILGDDDIWTMRCHCATRECRGRIRRIGSLPAALRERYIAAGMVPGYIIETIGCLRMTR